ncbi:MAG: M48 family metalloprotease [Phycisphaerae bacterium]
MIRLNYAQMIWAIIIYVFVSLLQAGTRAQVFHHWPPVIVVMLAGLVAVFLIARKAAGRARRKLNANFTKAGSIRTRLTRRLALLQFGVLAGLYYSVRRLGFGYLLEYHSALARTPGLIPFLYAGIIFFALFLIQLGVYRFACSWRHLRDTERLAMGKQVYPWPPAWQYALDMIRVTAGLVVSLLIFATVMSWCYRHLPQWLPNLYYFQRHADTCLSILLIPVFWIIYPFLLVRIMKTRRLPDGPLRQRLLAAARRHHIGITDIRIIQTHHRIANAAWIGTMIPPRYILITDLIVDDFTPNQVEDVFAHELGHGHHHHATWYLLLLLTYMVALHVLSESTRMTDGRIGAIVSAATPLLIVTLVFTFGSFSRLSELQADWFAAKHWAGRAHGTELADEKSTSGQTVWQPQLSREAMVDGAALGAEALRNLADQNMMRTDRGFLTHPSIDDRITHLYALSFSPQMREHLNRTARRWRWFISVLLATTLLLMVYLTLQH